MKIPESPPDFNMLIGNGLKNNPDLIAKIAPHMRPTDEQGRFLHWSELKHRPAPEGLTVEEWWIATKLARNATRKFVPLIDKGGEPFSFTLPDTLLRELMWLDHAGEGIAVDLVDIANPERKRVMLLDALMDEAIYSSQIEGAATTRAVARRMIKENLRPTDVSGRMILNNYLAMESIRDSGDGPLTPEFVLSLHRTLTERTLERPDQPGRFRRSDEPVGVYWDKEQVPLHDPPPAHELPERMERLCRFANDDNEQLFIHPLVKAMILHFMIGYDHPFVDGNGRAARGLFYWFARRSGYPLIEFLTISGAIKKPGGKTRYGAAYLFTETDGNDLTYFLLNQIGIIRSEIDRLVEDVKRKAGETRAAEVALGNEAGNRLNHRQKELLRHALRHPGFAYSFTSHATSHGVSHNSARNDLLELSDDLGFLDKRKRGKAWEFVSPADLHDRLDRRRIETEGM